MRAKRSKKYRKTMAAYQLHFSFRQPYQVLCDSAFLRQCHAFAMPVQKFLSNTLHGEARPFLTRCSLKAAEAAQQAKQEKKSGRQSDGDNRNKNNRGRGDGRPEWLPLPTEVPLRYCKHKDAEGVEVDVLDEAECLVDLVGGQARGNETRKNKNHYVLATAESEGELLAAAQAQRLGQNPRKRKRGPSLDVREAARQVPGVPIVYVKRSVMILEEMSGASERLIRGMEREKFKEGLIGNARGSKRKREDEDDSSGEDGDNGPGQQGQGGAKSRGGYKKARGPNPLSMRKKKVRPEPAQGPKSADGDNDIGDDGEAHTKSKGRKRKRGKRTKTGDQQVTEPGAGASEVAVEEA